MSNRRFYVVVAAIAMILTALVLTLVSLGTEHGSFDPIINHSEITDSTVNDH